MHLNNHLQAIVDFLGSFPEGILRRNYRLIDSLRYFSRIHEMIFVEVSSSTRERRALSSETPANSDHPGKEPRIRRKKNGGEAKAKEQRPFAEINLNLKIRDLD